jgi:hypothetical protein
VKSLKEPPVDIVNSYNFIACTQEFEHTVYCRQSGREGQSALSVLEPGYEVFQYLTGGIVGTGVIETLVFAGCLLHERCRLINGCRNGTCERINRERMDDFGDFLHFSMFLMVNQKKLTEKAWMPGCCVLLDGGINPSGKPEGTISCA